MEEWVNDIKEEFIEVCADSVEELCVFVENKGSLITFDKAEHVLLVAAEDTPTNNICRNNVV